MRTGRPFSSAGATKAEKLRTARKPFIHGLSVTNEFYAGKPRACCILLTLFRDEQNEREEEALHPTSRSVRITGGVRGGAKKAWLYARIQLDEAEALHQCRIPVTNAKHSKLPIVASRDARRVESWVVLRD